MNAWTKGIITVFLCVSFLFLAVFGVQCVYGYLFPVKFETEIEQACAESEIEQAVVFALVNVESHFDENASSSKGAVGLMQVMPSTAQEVADTLGMKDFDLKVPEQNVRIGTAYFAKLLKRFENLKVALAAYNAGPANVSSWLKDERYSDDGKTLKDIPFEETKNYIEKFDKNYRYYSKKI